MRKLEVGKGVKRNTRLDEYIRASFPDLPHGALYKAFRKKDIKINGTWAPAEAILLPGSEINVYIPDHLLFGSTERSPDCTTAPAADGFPASVGSSTHADSKTHADGDLSPPARGAAHALSIVYEDQNLLIINKAQGMAVHPDRTGRGVTLIELASEYLQTSSTKNAVQPLLCHRIDRNTGGLVLIAKNKPTLDYILGRLTEGSIKKYYRCIVTGKPPASGATLTAWLTKDASYGKVTVSDEPLSRKSQKIVTSYRLLDHCAESGTSLLEVALQTGRTHQIRAHLAFVGLPIIGDGKYCPNSINSRFRIKKQLLIAYKLIFSYSAKTSGILSYLAGHQFEVDDGLPSLSQLHAPQISE